MIFKIAPASNDAFAECFLGSFYFHENSYAFYVGSQGSREFVGNNSFCKLSRFSIYDSAIFISNHYFNF